MRKEEVDGDCMYRRHGVLLAVIVGTRLVKLKFGFSRNVAVGDTKLRWVPMW